MAGNSNYKAHQVTADERCALVTGSSNGIGEAVAKALARENYKLVVTGRNKDDVRRVAEQCHQLSGGRRKPLEVVADLAKEEDVDRLFELSMQFFQNRLDLLVNNAGIGQPVPHTDAQLCYDTFKVTLQVNLISAARLTLLAAPVLKETAKRQAKGTSSIVNISSIAALRPSSSLAAYGSSKAALCMYTSCMAVELAPLIRVNCILPGPIETKIIARSGFDMSLFKAVTEKVAPLGRIGQPDEVAEAVLFLADPNRASFVTGAQLTVDGGASMGQISWD